MFFRRYRRGVSTVLGAIIFVGILFSAVIPMYLVMEQADSMYEKNKLEMGRQDEERAREKLFLCAYPNHSNSSELKLKIQNRGSPSVVLVRVWINDEYHSQNVTIQSMRDKVMGPFPVILQDDSYYNVKVTTRRGNVFTSASGTLYYSDGIWYTPEIAVSVSVLNDQGQYYIKVENETHVIEEWYSEGIVHDDFVKTFEVYESGIYSITIKRKISGKYRELAASPATVQITWPEGPPIAFVFADGDEFK